MDLVVGPSGSTSFDGVLANDSDIDGDSLTASVVSFPIGVALTFNDDGTFVYSPLPGFVGTDSFDYVASVTIDVSASQTLPLAITAVGSEKSNGSNLNGT